MRRSFTAFLSATKPNLHTQDISHGLSGFFLCRSRDMGIGVQGEACGEVAGMLMNTDFTHGKVIK